MKAIRLLFGVYYWISVNRTLSVLFILDLVSLISAICFYCGIQALMTAFPLAVLIVLALFTALSFAAPRAGQKGKSRNR